MVCCKLDKIDKIFISLLCIFVTFTCIINTFCFASENVNNNLVLLNNLGDYNGKLNTSSTSIVGAYLKTDFNERYLVINNRSAGSMYVVLTKELPEEDVQVYNKYTINSNSEVYIDINNSNYKYIYIYTFMSQTTNILNYLDIYKTNINGLSGAINLLTDKVGFNILDSFINLLPYVLVVVTVSLGFYFILHAIIEVSKGRDL